MPEGAPGARFKAQVDVFEAMGSEVYLYLSCGDDTIVARVEAKTRARVGDSMEVLVDLNKIHAFDPETECAIAHGSGRGGRCHPRLIV